MFKTGAINGGLYQFEGELPKIRTITLYITVEDIEKSLETVKTNGGQVVKQKFLIGPGIGYTAFFKDTEGNELGLYSKI